MVIYFTGTGNSRFLAKLVAEQLNDEIVCAGEHIQKGSYPQFSSQAPYVFVAPTYAWRMPRVFETWIRACRFAGSRKAYYILSCGSGIGGAGRYAKELSDAMGFVHMGTAAIQMPENYIAVFSAPDAGKVPGILERARGRAKDVAACIRAQEPLAETPVTMLGRLCSGFLNEGCYRFSMRAEKFYATDACISCGKCAQECVLNNITLKDGKPVWGNHCTHCMACICKCPVEAIEYGKHSKGLRRYVCPEE